MKYSLSLVLNLLVILFEFCSCELLGVIQVNRHGARTGNNFDDLTSFLFFGSTDSQLTINGYKQQELLGQWIAERYMLLDYKLLSKDFSNEEMIIKASPIERTIFSAVGFIKGLYPNSEIKPVFTQNLETEKKMKQNDMPPIPNFKLRLERPEIPIIITDPDNDRLFHAGNCKLDPFLNETVADYFVLNHLFNFTQTEINNTVDEIISIWPSALNGQENKDIYNEKFLKILNAFIRPTQYHFDNNFFNLSYLSNEVLNKIEIQKWYGKRIVDSTALKFIVSGIFDEFLHYMEIFRNRATDKVNNKLKYALYSGHDGSIISIIANLFNNEKLRIMINEVGKFYNFLQPDFASHFIIEVHSDNFSENNFLPKFPQFFIRILYNGRLITDGFKDEIVYNNKVNGIEFNSFVSYLKSRVDIKYKQLNCKRKGKT